MPRSARVAPGGMVFHVLNRGVGQMTLFEKHQDYEAFDRLIADTLEKKPVRICAYYLMPNHWHFVLWPREVDAIRRCIRRGQPLGKASWMQRVAKQLGLESTVRAPHRPRKSQET